MQTDCSADFVLHNKASMTVKGPGGAVWFKTAWVLEEKENTGFDFLTDANYPSKM